MARSQLSLTWLPERYVLLGCISQSTAGGLGSSTELAHPVGEVTGTLDVFDETLDHDATFALQPALPGSHQASCRLSDVYRKLPSTSLSVGDRVFDDDDDDDDAHEGVRVSPLLRIREAAVSLREALTAPDA